MVSYSILTAFELEGSDYIAILLHESDADEDELMLCRYRSLSDEEIGIYDITDSAEFEQVLAFFNSLEVKEQ